MAQGPDEHTIDELARHVALPSSTIRLYQQRGILPPPRRHGRAAYYGPGHIARIELIGRLQERGFSLAAIGELVAGWEAGRQLDEVLGLESTLPGADRPSEIRLTSGELSARFPGQAITPEVMQRVLEMRMIEVEGDELVVRSPGFLDVGAALVELGFPLADVLDEAVTLQTATDEIAERFATLFERHVWRPFAAAGMPPDRLAGVTNTLSRLGPLAERVVLSALRQSLADSAERVLAREAQVRS